MLAVRTSIVSMILPTVWSNIRASTTGNWWCITGSTAWCRRSRVRRSSKTAGFNLRTGTNRYKSKSRRETIVSGSFLVLGGATMRSQFAAVAVLVTAVFLAAGCQPADCVYPLYKATDTDFDDRLLGIWQPAQADASDEEKQERWSF